jgi:hypothetical protein
MRYYDSGLVEHGRLNHAGASSALSVIRDKRPIQYDLCDYLWNTGNFDTLFVELWRLHEGQINRLSKAYLRKVWRIPAYEVNAFFGDKGVSIDGWRLFELLFDLGWQNATGIDQDTHIFWVKIRNQLVHSRSSIEQTKIEQGCVYLCDIINKLSNWGLSQSWSYDGLVHLGSIGLPTSKTAEASLEENLSERLDSVPKHLLKQWQRFLERLENNSRG